jgi:hypothetical protein
LVIRFYRETCYSSFLPRPSKRSTRKAAVESKSRMWKSDAEGLSGQEVRGR